MTPVNGASAPPPSAAEGAPPPAPSPEAESEIDAFRHQVDHLVSQTDVLERRVNEVVDFHDGKEHGSGGRKAGGGFRHGAYGGGHSKGRPDLFRQFGVILREITSHDWAGPFKEPVDVVALHLDDYYQIISKPMDFSTIQNKMEGKDGTKYNNVQELCSDVRLIFANAMKYNDEQHDVHRMAKTLLEIFEQKWLRFLPKVESEERRQKEEESIDIVGTNTSRESAVAKLATDTDDKLSEINKKLEELRKMVVQRCRYLLQCSFCACWKMTIDEKRKLGAGLCDLCPDNLNKALEIVAQDNPSFLTEADEVDLDMDAQSETTLWRLKFFMREALERQANVAAGNMDENSKRKREICNAPVKTAPKRIKKQPL